MSFLEVETVSKYFSEAGGQRLCVFKDVRLHIEKSEFVTMVGHSGCGKSTLLNIIAGLEKPTEGAVILDGREVDTPGLDRMVVFQNFSLLPWMSVYENIRLAVKAAFAQWEARKINDYVQRYVNMVGLAGSETKRPAALSGGMRQRVGLARAFAVQPKVLLLDEPFAQIDALTRGTIQDELMRMWTATRNTVFMVTHDVEEAILLSDKIALMTSGPSAQLAEIVEVTFPRPRVREEVLDLAEFARIKKHVINFLKNCVRERPANDTTFGTDALVVTRRVAAKA
ncbi:MAG TPA: ABC transporter ATP-binding protein [Candidatus Binatia bacterium]|jgi:nitrate/nitrite transport system ATP-binding protein|nr:ABC transporter ATP-binding protein [Candidatus Binatia bacterium]